jgi:hypothetical protein
MISLLAYSLAAALVAYTYCMILTEPSMILNPWYNFLDEKLGSKPWIFKPLVGCMYCVSGQAALWGYLILYYSDYSLLQHLFFISFAIYITPLINKFYTWTQQTH